MLSISRTARTELGICDVMHYARTLTALIRSYPQCCSKQNSSRCVGPVNLISRDGNKQTPTVADDVELTWSPMKSFRAAPALLQRFRHHPLHHDRIVPRFEGHLCNHGAAISKYNGNFCDDQRNLMSDPRW
jgi:hypothetical protein